MSAEPRRSVVVTGVGVLSAFGRGPNLLEQGLRAGRSALAPLRAFPPLGLPLQVAAEVDSPLFDAPDFPDDRKASLAFAAVDDAVAAAGAPRLTDAGVWLGTGLSTVTVRELNEDVMPFVRDGVLDRVAVDADLRRDHVAPRRHLPERVTAAVARRVGALGPQSTSFSACAAGAQAIANAAWAIRRGEVNIAIAGGHDSMIHPLGVLSFIVLGALSPTTCRPFDHGRDGFVIGEGAAMFVLEEESAAIARGATIWARLLGAGNSTDAHNATAPHPEGAGAALSMRRALVDARLPASAVQHVNAHGTGTPLGDAAEANAIRQVIGAEVPVSSIKGAVGHCIAAAGAVEAAACVLAARGGWSFGTAGLSDPAPLGVNARAEPAEDAPQVLLSNSFGFGGQNTTLLIGAPGFTPS